MATVIVIPEPLQLAALLGKASLTPDDFSNSCRNSVVKKDVLVGRGMLTTLFAPSIWRGMNGRE
jgi:hypothetical protein